MNTQELATWLHYNKTKKIVERNSIAFYGNGDKAYNNLNLSSIESFLVKQAGKWCDHYASDVVIGINVLENGLLELAKAVWDKSEEAPAHRYYFFGFRDMGVDGNSFVKDRLENPDCYGDWRDCYTAIYVVDVLASPIRSYYPSYTDITVSFYGLELADEKEVAEE